MSATAATAPINGSYVQRVLTVTLTLATGKFGTTGYNTATLPPLRAVASIIKAGFPSMDKAQIRVYGVDPSIMNQVSTLGVPITMARPLNAVLLEAGDAVNGMAVVYSGYMISAFQDFSGAPETFLSIVGIGGIPYALAPVPPISFPGAADVATMLSGIANRMGWAFENNGVSVKLANPYYPGTALEQAHAIARAANIELYFDTGAAPGSQPQPGSGTLAIWPKTGIRASGTVPLISATSGMSGYPKFQSSGMSVRSLYNKNLKIGGAINVQSTAGNPAPTTVTGTDGLVAAAGASSGAWYVTALSHDLSAQMPNGPWFSDITCARLPGQPP